jgi:hypothetical protein
VKEAVAYEIEGATDWTPHEGMSFARHPLAHFCTEQHSRASKSSYIA